MKILSFFFIINALYFELYFNLTLIIIKVREFKTFYQY